MKRDVPDRKPDPFRIGIHDSLDDRKEVRTGAAGGVQEFNDVHPGGRGPERGRVAARKDESRVAADVSRA